MEDESEECAKEKGKKRLERVDEILKEWKRRRCYGMTEILPHLFLGNMGDAGDLEQLRANKITDVLAVHNLSRTVSPVKSLNILHIRLSDQSGVNIADHFDVSNSFIHSARLQQRSVLVHCLAGASRSVCLVAAYLLTVTDMDYATTLAFIASKRPCANPNFGFRMQLIKFFDKKVCVERSRLQDEFGSKAISAQRGSDARALGGFGLRIGDSLQKSRSELNVNSVSTTPASTALRSATRQYPPPRDLPRQHTQQGTCKKSASSDCLASSPRSPHVRISAFFRQLNDLAFIDQ